MEIVEEKGVRRVSFLLDGYNKIETETIIYTKVIYYEGHKFLYGKSDKYKFTTLWEAGTGVCTQNLGINVSFDDAVKQLIKKVAEAKDKGFSLAMLVDRKRNANKLILGLWEINLYLP